mmetsp:Transcript_24030/g.62754  ORF Transcript_24030/g.62754 Transcript_24030/m.62754 type:complete len:234 (-) Transcript_24030:40-741(-)
MFSELIPMISNQGHNSVVCQTESIESVQNLANVTVDVGNSSIVPVSPLSSNSVRHGHVCLEMVIGPKIACFLIGVTAIDPGNLWCRRWCKLVGCQVQLALVVKIPSPLRGRPVHMRPDETNRYKPRRDTVVLVRSQKLDCSSSESLVSAIPGVVFWDDARAVIAAETKALVVPHIFNTFCPTVRLVKVGRFTAVVRLAAPCCVVSVLLEILWECNPRFTVGRRCPKAVLEIVR